MNDSTDYGQTIICPPVTDNVIGNSNDKIIEFQDAFLELVAGDDKDQFQCVLVNSCTSAIELCLYANILNRENLRYFIPEQTYISIPQIVDRVIGKFRDNGTYSVEDIKWVNYYNIGNIIDSAAYIPNGCLKDMFLNSKEDIDYICFSFGNSKPLKMDQGGMIVFRKDHTVGIPQNITIPAYDFFKRASHNGRDSALSVMGDFKLNKSLLAIYDSQIPSNGHFGFKMNLVPEQVEKGLGVIQSKRIDHKTVTYEDYPNIRIMGYI